MMVSNSMNKLKHCGSLLVCIHTWKWLSNSELVLSNIPREDQATEIELEGSYLYRAKALGVLWLAKEDVFVFHFKPTDTEFVYMKRTILKKVASLFDPLGFFAPYLIRAKILLQKVWASGTDWDEPLDPDLQSEACQWFSELTDCKQIHVPRCFCHHDCCKLTSTELHAFSDASADAYATVASARCSLHMKVKLCHETSSVQRQKLHHWNLSAFLVLN